MKFFKPQPPALIAGLIFIAGCAGPARTNVLPMLPAAPAVVAMDAEVFADGKGPQLVVTSKSDAGHGSLRDTVAKAKAGSTISFRLPKHAQIALTTGAIAIAKSLKIIGPGASLLTISGSRKSQIFSVAAHVNVTIDNVTLRNGSAAQGGAVSNLGSLNIDKVTFKQDVAPGSGATADVIVAPNRLDRHAFRRGQRAIRHAHAPRVMFPDSLASGIGGAIYNAAQGKLKVTNSIFSGDSAAYGGAIYNAGTATLTSDTFANNAGYRGSGSPLKGAFGNGAAIYDGGKLTVTSCTFTSNVAGGNAQGSYGLGGAIAQYSGSLKVVNSVFNANVAGGGSNGSWGNGGAIYTTAGAFAVSGSSFTSNQAGGDEYGYGGGIYADQFFTGSKDKFSQNTATGSSASGAAYGGAVYAGDGLLLSSSTFSTNGASGAYAFGGAIDSESNSTLTADSFASNAATAGAGGFAEGGAVYLGGGNAAFTSVAFSVNRASATGASSFANGGAVSAFAGLSVAGASAFANNTAAAATSGGYGGEGGALAIEQGPLTFTGSITHNAATTQGGGLWVDATATITNSTISSNAVTAMHATNDGGGGIYAAYAGSLTMTGSTVAANSVAGSAAYAGGGGIFNTAGATITNSTIANNTSSAGGGGFENDAAGGVSFANVTIFANTALGAGGNVKNLYADASMSIANSIVAGGSAAGVPNDISNDGSISSGDYNIVQSAVAGNALGGTTTHNLAADPQLAGLASNGGLTQTNADSKTSPGTAYVPFNNCLAFNISVDQRGLPRDPVFYKDTCDVGAYENQDP